MTATAEYTDQARRSSVTTYVVSAKVDGVRWYVADKHGWSTQEWERALKFSSVEEARAASADGWVWPVVEVQTGHDDGKPFVFRTLPATAG